MKIILFIMIGLSLVHAEFLRDATKEVVQDTSTNLTWQDNATPATTTMNWTAAITYCENLTLATFTDWRLPNRNELKSIVNANTLARPPMSPVFQHKVSSPYWSSTPYASNTAWRVKFDNGSGGPMSNSDEYYVRCVRGGE